LRRRLRALALLIAVVAAVSAAYAPPASARVAKGFWGVTHIRGVSEFPIYDDLGVDIFQYTIRWDQVASTRPKDPRDPADPAYRWPDEVQFAVDEARKHKMRISLVLTGGASWANGGKSWQWPARDPDDFADFARAAARRYRSVRLWQVWAEPTREGGVNWQPMEPMGPTQTRLTRTQAKVPRRYARILDAAYGGLKAINKRNLVIGGSSYTAGDIRPVQWVQNLRLPNGRAPRMDLYGHNPFTMREPNLRRKPLKYGYADFSDLDWFNRVVDRNLARGRRGRHLRLFLGEFTVPSAERDLEFSYWVTPETQAKWVTSGFRVARQMGAYAFGWIPLRDDPPRADGAPVRNTGLLYSDGRKKPAYLAFKRE
jgi:hypothetical protein